MGRCKFCNKENKLISKVLETCRKCLLELDWNKVKEHLVSVHARVRKAEGLPPSAPKALSDESIYHCNLCINKCNFAIGDLSYCGLRTRGNKYDNISVPPTRFTAYMHGYLDNNPTNCCNAWFCPAGTSNGFPTFSTIKGPEYGTLSYAAFLYGCSFNCLFCQNQSHKHPSILSVKNVNELALEIVENEDISCICYFGGTPEPQLPFTINLSKKILELMESNNKKRIIRSCWEWNGTGKRQLVEKCMKIAIKTGGNIKFDLKAYNEKLNIALCGVTNTKTLNNFRFLAETYFGTRGKDMPELSACTLLVPGYVNHEEVDLIASFIASINDEIPYSILIFHPDYQMMDLPITPRSQVEKCLKTAQHHLKNVHIGNKFLL